MNDTNTNNPAWTTAYLVTDNANEFLLDIPMTDDELAQNELAQTEIRIFRHTNNTIEIDGRRGLYTEDNDGFLIDL